MRIGLIFMVFVLFLSCTCDEVGEPHPCDSLMYYKKCNQNIDHDDKDQLARCRTKALLEDIYRNVKYPAEARELDIQGTVVTRFFVEKNGSVNEIHTVQGIGHGCDEECIRVIRLISDETGWNPTYVDCNPIVDTFILPIKFKLQ